MKKIIFLLVFLNIATLQAQSINMYFENAYNFKRITNVYAVVEQAQHKSQLFHADKNGRINLSDIKNAVKLSFYAENYQAFQTSFNKLSSHDNIDLKVVLRPDSFQFINPENDPVLIDAWVMDKYTAKPIKNAEVYFNENKISLKTDADGKFYLKKDNLFNYLQLKEGDSLSFSVKAPGYKTYQEGIRFSKSREFKGILLEPTQKRSYSQNNAIDDPKMIQFILDKVQMATPKEALTGCSGLPTTIKVGLNCSCNSCSSVATMTLQSYVEKGLNDEWIASWEMESLKAGTLPYKTYGAYYVLHPISTVYDISNTTCKQVWDNDVSSRCVTAAADTNGVFMVTASDNIARTEYSAENNGLNAPANEGCGDGYSGTGSSWPCIADNVCAGHDRYGHGRGMCQWGTQRWALQYKNYQWITDHYYNPGYMYRCDAPHPHPDLTPVNATLDVGTVAPGHVVNSTLSVQNIDQGPSDRTKLGFFLSTDQTFDTNDTRLNYLYISALNGFASQNFSRSLTIPANTADGTYYVLFVADYEDYLSESNESNNVQSVQLIVDSSTAVNDNFITKNIQLFPNPTKGKISIKTSDAINISKVEVYTMLGQKIENLNIQNNKIDIHHLANGSYLIKITDDKQNTGSFKILKK